MSGQTTQQVLGWLIGTSSAVTASAITAGVTITLRGLRKFRAEHNWLMKQVAENAGYIKQYGEAIELLLEATEVKPQVKRRPPRRE